MGPASRGPMGPAWSGFLEMMSEDAKFALGF